jgi:hypothetical protein
LTFEHPLLSLLVEHVFELDNLSLQIALLGGKHLLVLFELLGGLLLSHAGVETVRAG